MHSTTLNGLIQVENLPSGKWLVIKVDGCQLLASIDLAIPEGYYTSLTLEYRLRSGKEGSVRQDYISCTNKVPASIEVKKLLGLK